MVLLIHKRKISKVHFCVTLYVCIIVLFGVFFISFRLANEFMSIFGMIISFRLVNVKKNLFVLLQKRGYDFGINVILAFLQPD